MPACGALVVVCSFPLGYVVVDVDYGKFELVGALGAGQT